MTADDLRAAYRDLAGEQTIGFTRPSHVTPAADPGAEAR